MEVTNFAFLLLFIYIKVQSSVGELEITLLHTNDVHSRFEQAGRNGGPCNKEDVAANNCFGGFARLYHKAEEIRKNEKNVIYLSGGDYYQGSVWYTLYKWDIVSHFVNQLNHTAMAFGNHEFDNGIAGIVPFLEAATFPVISCNIDDSMEPTIQGKYKKSIVVEYEGVKVGIIGYTTEETMIISNPGKLIFKNVTHSVAEEARKLYEDDGIRIIVAVGHAGHDVDLKIAKIPYIDIVVGGHTNTFLYSGSPPDRHDVAEGEYPVVVTDPSGRKVLVVQAYGFGKYLGYMKVKFDESGEITTWSGNPILLDKSVPEDPEVLADVKEWGKKVLVRTQLEIGQTKVFLDGNKLNCRLGECNLGNVIADAMVFMNYKNAVSNPDFWTEAPLAFLHGGSIRSSIDEKHLNGSITMNDLLKVQPFGHTIDLIEIKGEHLKEVFEYAVEGLDFNDTDPSGKFLQISGMHVTYDITKPNGNRVKRLYVMCRKCRIPRYLPMNDTQIYKVVVPGYLAEGGNGYAVLKNNIIAHHLSGMLDLDALLEYLKLRSPITQAIEGRIIFETDKSCKESPGSLRNALSRLTALTRGLNRALEEFTQKIKLETPDSSQDESAQPRPSFILETLQPLRSP